MDTRLLEVAGQTLETDALGYLEDPQAWTPEIANHIAAAEGITLATDHWHYIDYVRAHYEQTHCVPEARYLLKEMASALGAAKGTRHYLHQLFPYGYGPQLCKIAGMRMPRKVMLDV